MGKNKSQTIGYKYYLGVHFVLCQAPIDALHAVKFQDSIAWEGYTPGGQLSINEPNLFGGQGKEGGVCGTVDVLAGKPTQAVNDYLSAKAPPSGFAATISGWLQSNFPTFFAGRASTTYKTTPAFRGIFSVVFRQLYIGNTPYLKPVRFKARNVFSTFGDWLPAIAPIGPESTIKSTSIYLAIDVSISMVGVNLTTMKTAVTQFLAGLKGQKNSVHLVAFASTVVASKEILNCTDADYDTLIAWVEALTLQSKGADFGVGLSEAATFFSGSSDSHTLLNLLPITNLTGSRFWSLLTGDTTNNTSVNEAIFFVTAGIPNPTSSVTTAVDLLATTLAGIDVFCFNIVNPDTSYTALLDNTPMDGIPVIGKKFTGYLSVTPTPLNIGVSPVVSTLNLEAATGLTGAQLDALAANGAQVTMTQSIYAYIDPAFGGGDAGGSLSSIVNCYDGTGTQIYAIEGSAAMGALDSFSGIGFTSIQFTLPVGTRTISYGSAYALTLPLVSYVDTYPGTLGIVGASAVYDNSITGVQASISSFCDLNPIHILRDLILNPVSGGSGDDTTIGASFETAAATIYAEGLGMSLLNASPSSRDNFKSEIERHIDANTYFDQATGKWEVKLIRDDYVLGDLHTFDGSTIMEWTEAPVRAQQEELPNQITVVYTNRKDGTTLSYTVTNTAAVKLVGVVIPEKKEYLGFTTEANARYAAGRDLSTLTVALTTGAVRVSWVPVGLNLGSAFIINDPRVGISNMVCRVTEMEIGDGNDNSVVIRFVEDTYGRTVSDTTTSVETTTTPDTTALAPSIEFVRELPYWALVMQRDQQSVDDSLTIDPDLGFMLGTCDKPSDQHIDAEIARLDGSTWDGVTAAPFAPYAVLSSDMTAAADDLTFTIPFNDALSSISANDLLTIDSEVMRVDSMSLSGSVVTVTVGRGCLDTVPAIHLAGAAVVFWWPFFGTDGVQYTAGETQTYRLLPRTSKEMLSISSVASVTVTFNSRAQRPYPIGKLQVGGVYTTTATLVGLNTFTWQHRDRSLQTTEIVLDFTAASVGPEVGDVYYALRRTLNMRADLFTVTDIFAESWFFIGSTGSEDVQPFGTSTPVTANVSLDDIDFFSWTDFFAQADFFQGAFLPTTLALEWGVRTKNGTYTNWQDPVMRLKPLLPPIDVTVVEV